MNFTLNWLKQYIDTDIAPAELADRLTMLGLEVDTVEDLYPGLDNVFVARVDAVRPHPGADKLTLCEVAVGGDLKQVVCGAPNVRPGLYTAIALPGAVLPSGFMVKPAKIRGVVSEGMLCSEKELGLGEEQAGIMELAAISTSGQPLVEALDLKDTFVEVDLTPNRPDCASVIGIAREVAGFTGKRLRLPVVGDLPELNNDQAPFAVEVRSDDCRRYAARLIKNLTIGPSPWWLKQRLLAVGLRPINNVVDITNFVMMEYGQPLHAFDFDRLAGGRIVVRKAREGEAIETLDGVERRLDSETLLICDAEKPVAVAGIMGGAGSEVQDATATILLESACFDAVSIRRTAGKLNMGTDSSYRFERGVDPQGVPKALERAVRLIVEIAGGEVAADGVDYRKGVKGVAAIPLRARRLCDLLGMELSVDEIAKTLAGIEIEVEKIDGQTLTVRPPSFRIDLEREIDLVEEVARLVGYNSIPTTLPLAPLSFSEEAGIRGLRRKAAGLMVALGFHEALNYTFVTPRHSDMLGLAENDRARQAIRLLNPLAEDQSVMRTSLLPGILENLRHNVNHQSSDVRLFEIGKTFYLQEKQGQPGEEERLTAVLSGRKHPGSPLLWEGEAATVDIYDVKGVVEEFLARFRLPRVALEPAGPFPAYAEQGSFVRLVADGRHIGDFGAVRKKVLGAFGIKQEVFYIDIHIDALNDLPPAPKSFVTLPKFPAVRWDLAVLVPERVAGGDMLAAIENCAEAIVDRAEIFDVYRGKNIEEGMKSVALSITYRAVDRTLDDETVGKVHQKIIDLMITRFNGQLREA